MTPDLAVEAWFGNRRGLAKALGTVGLSFDELVEARPGVQAVAAMLTWHYSTTAPDLVSPEVGEQLVVDLDEYVGLRGRDGHLSVCMDGKHTAVAEELITADPAPGCHSANSLYQLQDLNRMAGILSA